MACIAVLLHPVASLSHASHAVEHGHWHEVCHESGLVSVFIEHADEAAHTSPDQPHHASHHCHLCCGHGALWALPPTSPDVTLSQYFHLPYPRLFLLSPHTQHVWRTAQPRGPPTHS
ncbi:DUF2946 domain-containing protein [Pseudomonas helleri]